MLLLKTVCSVFDINVFFFVSFSIILFNLIENMFCWVYNDLKSLKKSLWFNVKQKQRKPSYNLLVFPGSAFDTDRSSGAADGLRLSQGNEPIFNGGASGRRRRRRIDGKAASKHTQSRDACRLPSRTQRTHWHRNADTRLHNEPAVFRRWCRLRFLNDAKNDNTRYRVIFNPFTNDFVYV